MTNSDLPNQTSSLYNVQPTPHTTEKGIFPSLPYTSGNLKFINKFNFQFSDLTDTEYITLCNMLLKYKPKDPNNKNKPAYKKYCSYCHRTNHSISCFKKNNEMM